MTRLFLLLLCMIGFLPLYGIEIDQVAEDICERIVKDIELSQPVFIEVRAGELSQALDKELRQKLLSYGTDIRELRNPLLIPDNAEGIYVEEDTYSLNQYNISQAILISITMDIEWQVTEQRNFLSYKSHRSPIYDFEIKTVSLPDYKLIGISNVEVDLKNFSTTEISHGSMKWFDPVIASLAIGSLIYLLWTTE